ncbi:MAG TPA: fibronectin type III domain-containing protein [Chthoniobacterales bacterium]|nr:fibronectin type III domain-containing protein [Chthoniobacterales bacterium]
MKKESVSQSDFFNLRVLVGSAISLPSAFLVLVAIGAFPDTSLLAEAAGQSQNAGMPAVSTARVREHGTRGEPNLSGVEAGATHSQGVEEVPAVAAIAPTRSSFMATWEPVSAATGYRLDVSTSSSFTSYVSGHQDLDVGNVTSRIIGGLSPGTTYYYRVRAYNALGTGGDSNAMTATTTTTSGLVINPTFDSSILNDPNSAAIQAAINRAIAIYQSLFSDPITVSILFRYSSTKPDGHPIPSGTLSMSDFVVYSISWDTYINALRADAKTANDATANASLPPNSLSMNISVSGANGRAIGQDTPPAMFADGTVGDAGPYDGIVSLNSTVPFQFTRPPSFSNYDAQRSIEHEIDEVLGLGSRLPGGGDLQPQDLFSWSAPGTRNLTSSGSRYFSINSGNTNIVGFNQDTSGDLGDWLSGSCPQANPYVQNAFGCTDQVSDVTATSPEGISLDVIGYDLVSPPPPGHLGNISTRAFVQTGDNVVIGGFIINGSGQKRMIVRAIGPSLAQHGITNPLQNPTLELHDHTGAVIASNDNWMNAPNKQEIINSGLAPTDNLESAILTSLNPGSYTAIMRGVSNGTGIGLVEGYDLDPTAGSKLGNISTRGLVQTGDNVMIGGFIITGSGQKNVIVRAIGPSLAQHGITNPLQDPTLELHNGNGAVIAFNDNWRDTQEAEIQATGLAPTDDRESAIVRSLTPGNYTAIVRGKNNTIGVALVEVYGLN